MTSRQALGRGATGVRSELLALAGSSSGSTAILMQVLGRSLSTLQQNAVSRQQQLAIAGQTSAAQDRLDVYGVSPMVLTDAANRLVAVHMAATAPRLIALLRATEPLGACQNLPTSDADMPESIYSGSD